MPALLVQQLDDMLQKFCPNGVQYSEIGAIAEVGTGSSNGNEADENGKYPFFVRSQTVKAKNHYEYDEEAIIIPGEGGIGDIFHYVNGKYALHQRVYRIHFTSPLVDVRFAYYYMSANFKAFIMRKAVSATVTSIRKPMIEQFHIPLPPLPVQQEIVRILDSFTELTAELTARRKQYEHYRDEILHAESTQIKTIADICGQITTGKLDANAMVENGQYPFFTCNAEPYRIDTYAFDTEAILVSGNGSQIGHLNYYNGKFNAYQRTYVLSDFQNVDVQYFYLYLKSYLREYIVQNAKKGSVPYITLPMLKKFNVPIPDLNTQREIAEKLRYFDNICSDLTSGLPAEIAAGQKQYEYYRDKLLTFKELEA